MSQTREDDLRALDAWIGRNLKIGPLAIVTHRNGDMDTIGSACAMQRIIGTNTRACGVHVSTIARELLKQTQTDFMLMESENPHWPRILSGVIIVDAAGPSQPGISIPDVPKCIIDHHAAGEPFDIGENDLEIRWDSCSTAEIIFSWAEKYAADRLDDGARRLLLAGIITDTGRFRHADSHALSSASRLVDKAKINFSGFVDGMEKIELNNSQKKAIAKALTRVQTIDAGGLFLSHTRASTNEGIVARSLISAGADIALVSRNLKGSTRLTGRASYTATKKGINLGDLMQNMVTRSGGEGGGHAGAAGWTGNIDQVDATSGFIGLVMDFRGSGDD